MTQNMTYTAIYSIYVSHTILIVLLVQSALKWCTICIYRMVYHIHIQKVNMMVATIIIRS